MSAPANRRSAGSRRFNPLKALQPKRRLQQMLSSSSPSPSVRTPAPASNRDPYGNASLSSSSNSGSCKGSDGSPTPRRHLKYTSCGDNHGIRPPPPEQYLTPLQQKEVCIRHLRARLKESVDRLQNRDSEIDELKTQLSRMQEDWIEEECHRVEAQLALKDARREIQQLKQVIDGVRADLSEVDPGAVHKCFQDISVQNLKLESLLYSMELAQEGTGPGPETGRDRGRGGVTRRLPGPLAHPQLHLHQAQRPGAGGRQRERERERERAGLPRPVGTETQDSGFVCGDSRADLLLEASLLSEETAALLSHCSRMPHSSTYQELCTAEKLLPLSSSHPCLSHHHHHHLFLHHLREQAIQTEGEEPVELDPVAERAFRSQACSPASTWLSEESDFDTVTTATTADYATDYAADARPPSALLLLPLTLTLLLSPRVLRLHEAAPPGGGEGGPGGVPGVPPNLPAPECHSTAG
ncbi:hypothetical protein AAFF_G00120450 [Aldrovandia affinis]|uniref:Uncharacterized protein n=1 Tax=Aldrovandia affinis TaxID=143900 RepID=A0AAD7W9Y2_9TELE|nr:hypothetical protein AAFF_G00120450 [Aldrovandia affinis]